MPLSRARDYMSIGEVLEAVRTDFPDVSVSKIRFLESEGLISPERTASGYRKFYESDVARLRYILSLQRDQFLPLRVIKERLLQPDSDGGGVTDAPAVIDVAAAERERDSGTPAPDISELALAREEPCKASGLSKEQLSGLQEFGLLPRRGDEPYNGNDLVAAKAAAGLFDYGVEPRHLRMFKQFAEREAAFLEQIVSPLVKKRDARGREEASQSIHRMIALTRQLQQALLRSQVEELL